MSGQVFANESAAGGNPPVTPTAPRRRRLSFSLRALFVFMTVASVFCAWAASRIHPYYRQRDQIAELVGKGARIEIEPDPDFPDWLARLLGDEEREVFVCPRTVAAHWAQFYYVRYLLTDDDLRIVGGWRGIKRLWLQECPVSDAGMESLRRLNDLENVYLSDTGISDRTLAHLGRNCPRLVSLNAENTDVTDEGIAHLAGLAELSRVSFNGCAGVRGHTLATFDVGSRPLWLSLKECPIDDEGLSQAARIERLAELRIASIYISEAGLHALMTSRQLNDFRLDDTQPPVWALLARAPKARWYWSMGGYEVTPLTVERLAHLRRDLQAPQLELESDIRP